MRLFCIMAAAALLAGCSRQEPAPVEAAAKAAPETRSNKVTLDEARQKSAGVKIDVAAERVVPETVRASARLTNDENRTWRVGAITDGRVVQVLASPGDFVKDGKPLARLHGHDVHDSRAQYRAAQAGVLRANSTLQYTQKARDRAKRLYELKAGSLEQLEHADAELRNAEAEVTRARTEVDRTRSHLVEFLGVPAEGGVELQPGQDSDVRDLIPILSPASGTVLVRNITPGTVVTPANDLFIISDLSSLWAIAEVNEEYLRQLKVGMPVRIYVQAWPQEPFAGRIGKLGEALDPATRTVKVRVDLPNRGGRLKPEMYASAEIDIGSSRSAVFVPEEAIQEVRGQSVVFVRVKPNQFEVRPVETGRTLEGVIEIVRGVKSGEAIATDGAFILKSEFLKSSMTD